MGPLETGWGLDLILWFQSWRTPLVVVLGRIFHALGSTEFYLTLLPLVYWCVDATLGRRLAVITTLSLWSNSAFKTTFQRPRPFMVSDQVRSAVVETSYGLPSGHSQGSATLWGVLAIQLRRRWVTLLVTLYLILMALSRMVLGVHYLQDVVIGLLLGLAAVALYAWLEPRLSPWLARQSPAAQIGVVVGVSALLLLIHPGLIPPTTPPWLSGPLSLDDLLSGPVTPVAGLLGLGVGFALEQRFVRFHARGIWWKRLARLVVGMAGVLVLRFGLKLLFAGLEPVFLFRLARYGLIGLWGGFGAPWLFVRTELAGQSS